MWGLASANLINGFACALIAYRMPKRPNEKWKKRMSDECISKFMSCYDQWSLLRPIRIVLLVRTMAAQWRILVSRGKNNMMVCWSRDSISMRTFQRRFKWIEPFIWMKRKKNSIQISNEWIIIGGVWPINHSFIANEMRR